MPWQGRFVHIGAHKLFYREAGTGPPVILVHGWTGNSHQWKGVVRSLARHHRLLAPDLPGCGRSDKPRIDYAISEILPWIQAFARTMFLSRFALVGTSFGGFLATRYALAHPGEVAALALLNASGIRYRYNWLLRACRVPLLRYLVPYLLLLPREVKLWLRARIHPRSPAHRERLRAFRLSTLTLRSWAGLRASMRSIGSITDADALDDRLAAVRCPTLIVWGDRDPALPRPMADVFHRGIPGSRLEILDGCGHNIPEERPAEVAWLLRTFLCESGWGARASGQEALPGATGSGARS